MLLQIFHSGCSSPGDRVRENPADTLMSSHPHLTPTLKNTDKDQVLTGVGGLRVICPRRVPGCCVRFELPVLAVSDIVEYNHENLAFAYQKGYIHGTAKIPAKHPG